MVKDKDTSGRHGSTPKPSANPPLEDLFTAEINTPESSRHPNNIIMEKSRKVSTIKIETIKKLLKNIKKQHELIKILTNLIKKEK